MTIPPSLSDSHPGPACAAFEPLLPLASAGPAEASGSSGAFRRILPIAPTARRDWPRMNSWMRHCGGASSRERSLHSRRRRVCTR